MILPLNSSDASLAHQWSKAECAAAEIAYSKNQQRKGCATAPLLSRRGGRVLLFFYGI